MINQSAVVQYSTHDLIDCTSWGHIGATSGPRTSRLRRTTAVTCGPASPQLTGQNRLGLAGRRHCPRLSRTEEVAWASIRVGSVPQRARAGIGGHQRHMRSSSRSPAFRLKQEGCCKQQISLRSPRSLTGKFRGPLLTTVGEENLLTSAEVALQTRPSHPAEHTNQAAYRTPTRPRNRPAIPVCAAQPIRRDSSLSDRSPIHRGEAS